MLSHRRSAKMLILFVLLLVTHQAAGHLQCPQVATSFGLGGEIDLSSFSVLLEQPEGVGDGGNVSTSDEDQCKLIAWLTVHYYVVAIYVTRSEKSRLPRTQQQDTLFTIKQWLYTLANNSAWY